MKVISLEFKNYRNLKDTIINPCEGVNIIYGDNAQGKTNLLEALWLFCGGHSFRSAKDSELINYDCSFSRLEMCFEGQERNQKAQILISGKKKKIKINGVEKKSGSALIEKFCAVVFSPDHLNLIKRGPSERRKFIDSAICREKLKNAVVVSRYNRLLNQRNSLLKEIYKNNSSENTLSVWDEQLAFNGAMLIKSRLDYVKQLSQKAEEYHRGISNGKEEIKIRYISSSGILPDDDIKKIKNKLSKKIYDSKQEDIRTGVTNFGPHHDDMEILINGRIARKFASQGQQKSAVLSMKLAEACILRERMGEKPVILLDDVLSELDLKRQDFLLNKLKECQVFITCCEKSNREQLRDGKVFFVKNGEVS